MPAMDIDPKTGKKFKSWEDQWRYTQEGLKAGTIKLVERASGPSPLQNALQEVPQSIQQHVMPKLPMQPPVQQPRHALPAATWTMPQQPQLVSPSINTQFTGQPAFFGSGADVRPRPTPAVPAPTRYPAPTWQRDSFEGMSERLRERLSGITGRFRPRQYAYGAGGYRPPMGAYTSRGKSRLEDALRRLRGGM